MKREALPIPAGVPEHHAPTLVESPGGDLLAAWFGGSKEGKPDVAIWGARRGRDGWGKAFLFAKLEATAHWNPVLARYDDELTLFFKVGRDCESGRWRTWAKRSEDDGRTWSAPESLVPSARGGRGPVKNKPIRLADGAWLAPGSSEISRWAAFTDRSDDRGRTWTRSRLIPGPPRPPREKDGDAAKDAHGMVPTRVIQPALWESSPGHVHMLLRADHGWICRSDSDDGGRTWRRAYSTALPNNNSGLDLARLKDGGLLLAYNPVGKDWGPRTPLALARSDDNGDTWRRLADLDAEDGAEFSYPAVIALNHGGAAVSYTWKRKHIAVATLTEAECR